MNKIIYSNYFLLLLVGVIWGTQFAFNNIALQSMTQITIAAGRSLIGFITLSIYALIFNHKTKPILHKKNNDMLLYLFIALFEVVCPLFLIA